MTPPTPVPQPDPEPGAHGGVRHPARTEAEPQEQLCRAAETAAGSAEPVAALLGALSARPMTTHPLGSTAKESQYVYASLTSRPAKPTADKVRGFRAEELFISLLGISALTHTCAL